MSRYTLTALSLLAAAVGVAAVTRAPSPAPSSPVSSPSPTPAASPTSPIPTSPATGPAFTPAVSFDTPATASPVDVHVAVDVDAFPMDAASTRYVVVTVSAPEPKDAVRVPVDLALVMDVSGSMLGAGKLDQAKRAALALVDTLHDDDRLALVTFDGDAHTLVGLSRVDTGRLRPLLQGLSTGSGTNLGAGMLAGLSEVAGSDRVRKVLLLTDGQANEGVTDPAELAGMAHADGVTLSTVGLGLDYNEGLLAQLADAGGGNYEFVDASTDLARLYANELTHASTQVSVGTSLRLRFGEGVRPVRAYAWDAQVAGQDVSLSLGTLSAGQSRTVVVQVTSEAGPAPGSLVTATVTGRTVAKTGPSGVRTEGGVYRADTVHAARRVATAADAAGFADAEAQGKAASAVAAAAVADATALYKQGDVEGGRRGLLEAATQLRQRGDALGDAAMRDQADGLQAMGYLAPAESVKVQSKAMRTLGRGEGSSASK